MVSITYDKTNSTIYIKMYTTIYNYRIALYFYKILL